jgi:hypothetical protein
MNENQWESVPEAFEADLTLQESFDLAVAKVHRFKAASLEAGVAIRKALPLGTRVQHGIGDDSWQGTIVSPQGAICDHMAGPVSVLPDKGSDVEPDFTTGEVQVDVTDLTAISNGKWHWMNQAMRLAHSAAHAAEAAGIEVDVAVHRLLLVGRMIETYRGEHPNGAICRGEVIAVGMFGDVLHVKFDGRYYGPQDERGDIVDIEKARLITDETGKSP